MKILTIRLKNLASIEGSFEVDFTAEPLRSAGIFAISGPTGAGKSTILDALCLALYDKTPRFAASGENLYLSDVGENQVNQSDVKNILRRGTGEGFAEVDFIGVTGRRYRSRWSVRRARSKATGSLQPQVIQVTDLDKEEELQGTKTELLNQLVALVGLTYEQFTRTVLLAQNDFATFLKSREAAKAELLEKLTGTEIYSRISREIYARSKAADEAMNLLKNTICLIELMPEEELLSLQKEQERLAGLRVAGTKRLTELNAQLNIVQSLKVRQKQLHEKQQEESAGIEELKKLQTNLTEQMDYLARFREQWEALQPELRKARELDVRLQSLRTLYRQSEQALLLARKQTAEIEKKYRASKEALCGSQNSINRLLKGKDSFALPVDLQQIEQLLLHEEQQLTALQQENDNRVSRLNAFGIQSVSEEQNKLLKQQTQMQRAAQAGRLLAQLCAKQEETSAELTVLMRQLAVKQEQVASLQRLYDNARMAISKDVVALRRDLHDGEACPVCGSQSHPYRQDNEVADTLYHSIEKEYKSASDIYNQLNNRVIALQRDIKNYAVQQKAQEEVLAEYPVAERTPEYLDARLTELQQALCALEEKMKQYQLLYAEWQQQDKRLKQLRTHYDAFREEVNRLRLLSQQSTAIAEQLSMAKQAETTELLRFQTTDKEQGELQQLRAGLLKGKTADEAEAVVHRREKELNEALELARKNMESVHVRILGIQGEIKQLSQVVIELSDQQKKIENPEHLPEEIVACQSANRETERSLSVVEARLLQQEQNKKRLMEIESEWKEKQAVAGQWAKLNKLVGSADGTKFKVIAQSYTLNLLLLHANKHLAYLSKRYRLQQVPGTLALQVIDCDMCDEVRTVYSLSGGESFLISLALALGLSSLSSNNLKVESLFIDEGFGSLDADSLRTAMEALEQLQMQGRKIGVISHVQEMSERISVQVQLHKSVNGRSEITIV